MPKPSKELTALQVKQLKNKGRHAVGGVAGLHLLVRNENSKFWVLRNVFEGRGLHAIMRVRDIASLSNLSKNGKITMVMLMNYKS